MRGSNYDKFPFVRISESSAHCDVGWDAIAQRLRDFLTKSGNDAGIIAIECYPGVFEDEIVVALTERLRPAMVVRTRDAMLAPEQIDALVQRDVSDDPVFGHLTQLELADFIDRDRAAAMGRKHAANGLTLVIGLGTHFVCEPDLLVYADLAR